MPNGLTRLASRFLGEPGPRRRPEGPRRPGPRRRGRRRGRAGDLHAGRHRLGRRGAPRHRGARRLLARRADRHGGLAALRRAGDARDQDLRPALAWQNWIFQRPNAVGPKGALQVYGTGPAQPSSTGGECDGAASTTPSGSPTTSSLADNRRLQRALEEWQPQLPRLVAGDGPRRLPGEGRLPAHGDQRRRRRAGRTSAT